MGKILRIRQEQHKSIHGTLIFLPETLLEVYLSKGLKIRILPSLLTNKLKKETGL